MPERPRRPRERRHHGGRWTAVVALTFGAACADIVDPPPLTEAIALDRAEVTLTYLGQSDSLAATPLGPDGSAVPRPVAWTVVDPGVATVSRGGTVTAAGDGETRAVVSSDGVSEEVRIVVARTASSLTLSEPAVLVLPNPGDTATVTPLAQDAGGFALPGAPVLWSVAHPTVASVDATGTVTALAAGQTTLTATAGSAEAVVEVHVLPELGLVAASPVSTSADVASSVGLAVRVEDAAGAPHPGRSVSWSVTGGEGSISSASMSVSDGEGFAGAVWTLGTGAGPQTARATITSRGTERAVDFTATATAGPAATMTLTSDSVLLSARGETAYLAPGLTDAYGNPAGPTPVAWSSDEPAVAEVAPDGLVTGQGAGATWIRGGLGASSDSILVTVEMRGAITLTFDDGWLSAYEHAVPVMEEFGLVGNVGVYTEAVGWPGYMSEGQLAELHDAGWTLVSHSVRHDSLTTLSTAELDYELRESQRWLVDRGYERGSRIFIAPYHDYGLRERIAVSGYYQASRGYSHVDSLAFWQPDNPYELTGGDADFLDYTAPAGRDLIRALLQRTLDEGRFVDLFFHQFAPADVAAFRETLSIVDEFRARVMPYHELYPELARTVR